MFNSYLKPMEPQTCSRAFNSEDHIFQVKWDGVRLLTFINQDRVRVQNRKLRDRTLQYPEIQSLAKQINAKDAILDGEMISSINYIDCLQNAYGKTIASVYSLRPHPGAPVSFPVSWEMVERGQVDPKKYQIHSVPQLLHQQGDLFHEVLTLQQSIDGLLKLK